LRVAWPYRVFVNGERVSPPKVLAKATGVVFAFSNQASLNSGLPVDADLPHDA